MSASLLLVLPFTQRKYPHRSSVASARFISNIVTGHPSLRTGRRDRGATVDRSDTPVRTLNFERALPKFCSIFVQVKIHQTKLLTERDPGRIVVVISSIFCIHFRGMLCCVLSAIVPSVYFTITMPSAMVFPHHNPLLRVFFASTLITSRRGSRSRFSTIINDDAIFSPLNARVGRVVPQ